MVVVIAGRKSGGGYLEDERTHTVASASGRKMRSMLGCPGAFPTYFEMGFIRVGTTIRLVSATSQRFVAQRFVGEIVAEPVRQDL